MFTPISSYIPSFTAMSNITPFTYKDGATFLNELDEIRRFVNDVLIKFINDNLEGVQDGVAESINDLITSVNNSITALESQLNTDLANHTDDVNAQLELNTETLTTSIAELTLYVNTKVAEILDSSVEVAETLILALINNPESTTTTALKALYAPKSIETIVNTGRLSEENLNTTYASEAVETAFTSGRLTQAFLDNRHASKSVQTLAETGRLTETYLDNRYINEPITPVAIFIGSSNSAASTLWPAALCTRMGWSYKNFSLGGGGFTADPLTNKFLTQLQLAIADTSYVKADVKYLFIVDCSNDIRAIRSVASETAPLFSLARTTFPNAKIIVVPALWNNTTTNIVPAAIKDITTVYTELVEGSLPYKVDVIPYSWTWHMDDKTLADADTVHFSTAGYTRVSYFIEKYLRGESTANDRGWVPVVPASPTVAGDLVLHTRREGNMAHIFGTIVVGAARGAYESIGNIAVGMTPISQLRIPAVDNNGGIEHIEIFPEIYAGGVNRGLMRWQTATPISTYFVDFTYPVF